MNPSTNLWSILRREAIDELAEAHKLDRSVVLDILTGSDRRDHVFRKLMKLNSSVIRKLGSLIKAHNIHAPSHAYKDGHAIIVAGVIVEHNRKRISCQTPYAYGLVDHDSRFRQMTRCTLTENDTKTRQAVFSIPSVALTRKIRLYAVDLSISPIAVKPTGELVNVSLSKVTMLRDGKSRNTKIYRFKRRSDYWEILFDRPVKVSAIKVQFPRTRYNMRCTFVAKLFKSNAWITRDASPALREKKSAEIPRKIDPLERVYSQTLSSCGVQTSGESLIMLFRSKVAAEKITLPRKLTHSSSNDVKIGTEKILLRCPITLQRMQHPGYSIYCRHAECFDVESLLRSTPETHLEFTCPICSISFDLEVRIRLLIFCL